MQQYTLYGTPITIHLKVMHGLDNKIALQVQGIVATCSNRVLLYLCVARLPRLVELGSRATPNFSGFSYHKREILYFRANRYVCQLE